MATSSVAPQVSRVWREALGKGSMKQGWFGSVRSTSDFATQKQQNSSSPGFGCTPLQKSLKQTNDKKRFSSIRNLFKDVSKSQPIPEQEDEECVGLLENTKMVFKSRRSSSNSLWSGSTEMESVSAVGESQTSIASMKSSTSLADVLVFPINKGEPSNKRQRSSLKIKTQRESLRPCSSPTGLLDTAETKTEISSERQKQQRRETQRVRFDKVTVHYHSFSLGGVDDIPAECRFGQPPFLKTGEWFYSQELSVDGLAEQYC